MHNLLNQFLPVNDKVCPGVDHLGGHVPVVVIEAEDAGGEEVQQLVAVRHAARNRRLLSWNEISCQFNVYFVLIF